MHVDFHTPGCRQLRERCGADNDDLDFAFESACSRGETGVGAMTARALLNLDRAVHHVTASTRRRMAAAHALLATAGNELLRAWLRNGAAPVFSVAIPGVPRLEFAEQRVAGRRQLAEAVPGAGRVGSQMRTRRR